MMNRLARAIVIACFLAMPQTSCLLHSLKSDRPEQVVPSEGYRTVDKFPFKEAWYGMYFQEDKVGYSHFKIDPSGSNFTIASDSFMRLTALKKTNEIVMKETVSVRPDLTMISFQSEVRMNGKDLKMTGTTEAGRFLVDIKVDGETLNREYPIDGKVYHSSAISFMPALRGLGEGKAYTFGVFNAERQGMQEVDQQVSKVKGEPGPNDAIWKVRNNYGRSVVHSWLDRKGLTVLEKGLDGSLVTVLEDESTAKKFREAKARGKDLILDVSLIKVTPRLPNPEKLRFLRVRMQGIEPSVIAKDHRQRISLASDKHSPGGFEVSVRTEDLDEFKSPRQRASSAPHSEEYLASTMTIQSDHKEIVSQAEKIVDDRDPPLDKVVKLVRWTAENIENKLQDSFTALAVLRSKEGECQSHANLYAALARSRKIPTRVVTGLVYTNQGGFLYHAWAESYVNGWLAVDPTSKQIPADATHIKIAAETGGDEASSLLKMLGKTRIEVLEYK